MIHHFYLLFLVSFGFDVVVPFEDVVVLNALPIRRRRDLRKALLCLSSWVAWFFCLLNKHPVFEDSKQRQYLFQAKIGNSSDDEQGQQE